MMRSRGICRAMPYTCGKKKNGSHFDATAVTVLLPRLATLHEHRTGAGDGNRTHAIGLGSRSSTIELHPLTDGSLCHGLRAWQRGMAGRPGAKAKGPRGPSPGSSIDVRQKSAPTVANTVAWSALLWPTVRLVPMLACNPKTLVRAPKVSVP